MTTWIKNQQGEKFTFPKAFVIKATPNFETGVDQQKLPISGPMNNQGIDIDGNAKTITISGQFMDTSQSVITVNDVVPETCDLRSMKLMKYWFEAILSGLQIPIEFSSYLDEFSALGSGNTEMFDPVSNKNVILRANYIKTRVYVIGFQCDDDEGDVERIPFTLTLWVAGI